MCNSGLTGKFSPSAIHWRFNKSRCKGCWEVRQRTQYTCETDRQTVGERGRHRDRRELEIQGETYREIGRERNRDRERHK